MVVVVVVVVVVAAVVVVVSTSTGYEDYEVLGMGDHTMGGGQERATRTHIYIYICICKYVYVRKQLLPTTCVFVTELFGNEPKQTCIFF